MTFFGVEIQTVIFFQLGIQIHVSRGHIIPDVAAVYRITDAFRRGIPVAEAGHVAAVPSFKNNVGIMFDRIAHGNDEGDRFLSVFVELSAVAMEGDLIARPPAGIQDHRLFGDKTVIAAAERLLAAAVQEPADKAHAVPLRTIHICLHHSALRNVVLNFRIGRSVRKMSAFAVGEEGNMDHGNELGIQNQIAVGGIGEDISVIERLACALRRIEPAEIDQSPVCTVCARVLHDPFACRNDN